MGLTERSPRVSLGSENDVGWCLGVAALVGVLCFGSASAAQDVEVASDVAEVEEQDVADAEAQARFTAGEIAFGAGRFEDALSDFRRAYELSERPQLLYNVGLAAYRLRNDVLAREYFERFIEALPDHPNAERAREQLQRIREHSANGTVVDGDDEVDDAAPAHEASRAGPWALGLAGGVALVGGGVLLALALADKSDIESMSGSVEWPQIEAQFNSVPRRSGAGIALLGVGGAAVVSAILWRVMTPDEDISVAFGLDRVCIEGSF